MSQFLRYTGDEVTRLDRLEPALNENLPDDPRDTTTPKAMVLAMQRLLLADDGLNATSRDRSDQLAH
ncbi:MAG: serine hydrolase [Caulobacteraceae bacterium]|nr:serine hydrolase [Caulobacteraceae bacterium]